MRDSRLLSAISEKEFQQQVLELAVRCRWMSYHTFDSRRSTPGFPDLTLVRPPRIIFAELKSQNGHMTADQSKWVGALAECTSVETYVWRPGDWEHITATLTGLGPRSQAAAS